MGASRNFILLAPKSIKFNPKRVKFYFFVRICGKNIQFCVDDSDFSNFGQVSQNLNVKPWCSIHDINRRWIWCREYHSFQDSIPIICIIIQILILAKMYHDQWNKHPGNTFYHKCCSDGVGRNLAWVILADIKNFVIFEQRKLYLPILSHCKMTQWAWWAWN